VYENSAHPGASVHFFWHSERLKSPGDPKLVVQRWLVCVADHFEIANCSGGEFPSSAVVSTGVHPAALSA
jgi:hypothetical protein